MLDRVKRALRLTTDAFDDEVRGLIDACKADLRLVGVNVPEETTPAEGEPTAGDPLINRAIIFYAKAHFGFNEDSEKHRAAYDYLKCALSLTGNHASHGEGTGPHEEEPGTGDYFLWLPEISEEGVLSWVRSERTTPPAPRNIAGADGQDGQDGAPGATPTATAFSIPTGAWAASGTHAGYPVQASITIAGLVAADMVDLAYSATSRIAMLAAGVDPVETTATNAVIVYAKVAPAVVITGVRVVYKAV